MDSHISFSNGRCRRLQTSESAYDGPPDKLSLIKHTFEEGRVGAPPLLPLPLRTSRMDQDSELYQRYHHPKVRWNIEEILNKNNMEVEHEVFGKRHIDNLPEPKAVTTLHIRTWNFHPVNDRNCVAELYELFQGSVTIELTCYELWTPRYISHLEIDHPFHQVWETDLRREFLGLLDTGKLAGKVRSVDLVQVEFDPGNHEWGVHFEPESPVKQYVVVSITVDWSIDCPDYKETKSRMLTKLDTAGFPNIRVEFERGEIISGVSKTRDVQVFHPSTDSVDTIVADIRPGNSISCEGNGNFGTVGVALDLVKAGSSEVVSTIVLTNSLVGCSDVSPAMEALKHDFSVPSPRAISQYSNSLKEILADNIKSLDPSWDNETGEEGRRQTDKLKSWIKTLESCNYSRRLGSIVYTGGGRLDVVGISVEGESMRKTSNVISKHDRQWQPGHRPTANRINQINLTFGKDDHSEGSEKEVYKIGASTGCSYGKLSSKKSSSVYCGRPGKPDWAHEVAVIGESGVSGDPCHLKGDLGAAIFDKGGAWLGLVCGVQRKLNSSQQLIYMTPAWVILEDIKKFFHGELESRLKV